MSGPTILDMKSVAAFWQKPVTEMGYLVDKQSLNSVQLDTLAVSYHDAAAICARSDESLVNTP